MYYSTSTIWRQRGLERLPRNNLDQLIPRAFLSPCTGTAIQCTLYISYIIHYTYRTMSVTDHDLYICTLCNVHIISCSSIEFNTK